MAFEVRDWLTSVLATTAMSTALLALVGAVFKDWIATRLKGAVEHRYSVALATFQADLRAQADKDVEQLKAELKRENDVELEKLKAQLSARSSVELLELKTRLEKVTQREQHAFVKLHDRRVDALAGLHSLAFRMQNVASRIALMNPSVGNMPMVDGLRQDVWAAVNDTVDFLVKNALYLPKQLLNEFELYRDHYLGFIAVIDEARALIAQAGYTLEAVQTINRAARMVTTELASAVTAVENSMRTLLGDQQAENESAASRAKPSPAAASTSV